MLPLLSRAERPQRGRSHPCAPSAAPRRSLRLTEARSGNSSSIGRNARLDRPQGRKPESACADCRRTDSVEEYLPSLARAHAEMQEDHERLAASLPAARILVRAKVEGTSTASRETVRTQFKSMMAARS